jgi:ferredoxin-NADP reductase
MNLKLVKKQHEVGNIYSFFFKPDERVLWRAGQYINVSMPDVPPVFADRIFTIASAPHEQYIQVTTFIGPSPFKQKLHALELGTEVEADQLGGDFYWQDSISGSDAEPVKKLYLAGGLGITPFRSIIIDRYHNKLPQASSLMWSGAKSQCPFEPQLHEVAARSEDLSIHRYEGVRITVDEIMSKIPDVKQRLLYLAGSQSFVESLGEGLMEAGVPRPQIKYDWFDGYNDEM